MVNVSGLTLQLRVITETVLSLPDSGASAGLTCKPKTDPVRVCVGVLKYVAGGMTLVMVTVGLLLVQLIRLKEWTEVPMGELSLMDTVSGKERNSTTKQKTQITGGGDLHGDIY